MNTVDDRVADVLTDTFKLDRSSIQLDTSLAALNFDSLILIQLGLVLEDGFGITIEVGEVTKDMTVRDVAELVAGKAETVP